QYVANRVSKKISKITDTIFICRSGSAADTQALADLVKRYLQDHMLETNEPARVKTAARLLQLVAYNNRGYLSAGMIIGGVDDLGPHVFVIPLGGSLYEQPYALGGSGSSYVLGMARATHQETFTHEQCEQWLITLVSRAMESDGSSGGVIRLVTIPTDGPVTARYLESPIE
ncbi:proteasome B-type subunit, partial [Kipferlia bialata]